MNDSIKVVLVDDHILVREGLRNVLGNQKGISIVGEGASLEEARTLIKSLKPDVVLLDLSLPDGNGLEIIPEVREGSPSTRILVLTIHDTDQYLAEALSAGASGYLLKDTPPKLIALAIRSLNLNGALIDGRMLGRLTRIVQPARRPPEAPTQAPARALSSRELEILRLISQGCGNREIGERLHLAEATVKKYVHSLKAKLNVHDRAQAAVVGMRLGLVE